MSDALSIEKETRKKPQQARSVATVEAILEATARILLTDGLEKLSTNRVAKVAGVSVGSLYQYFPNKVALIEALCQRHVDEMMDLMNQCLSEFSASTVEEAVRMFIHGMMQAHALEPELHHAVMLASNQLGLQTIDDIEVRSSAGVRMWLEMHRDEVVPNDLDLATFVLILSVEAVTHAGLLAILPTTEPELRRQKIEALEAEVNAFVLGYLGVPSTQAHTS